MDKPLALLDVDGVLNLFGLIRHKKFHVSEEPNSDGSFSVNKLPFDVFAGKFDVYQQFWRTNLPAMIERLQRTFDLVWATSWEHYANDFWLDKMGLTDRLPVIELSRFKSSPSPLSWKTGQVNSWLLLNYDADVRGVWFDDEVSRRDRPHLPEGMLPIHTMEHLGLNDYLIWDAERHALGLSLATTKALHLLDIKSIPEGDEDEVFGMLMNRRNAEEHAPSHLPELSKFNLRQAAAELTL